MSTRNATVLQEIIDVLFAEPDPAGHGIKPPGEQFPRPLADVGNVFTVGEYAEQLRLRITENERSVVLDYIAEKQMVMVTIGTVEDAINERFAWERFWNLDGKEDWRSWSFF